jgi:hypothetical protein
MSEKWKSAPTLTDRIAQPYAKARHGGLASKPTNTKINLPATPVATPCAKPQPSANGARFGHKKRRNLASRMRYKVGKPIRDQLKSSVLEKDHGRALIRAVDAHLGQWPELRWLFHVPNGGKRERVSVLKNGVPLIKNGNVVTYCPAGKELQLQGQKSGVPDYHLPVKRGDCPGMVFELKRFGEKATEEQEKWLVHYASQGWVSRLFDDWQAAWDGLLKYLRGELT